MEELDHPLEEGTVYRCPVESCHTEIEVRRQMEKVSIDEPIG